MDPVRCRVVDEGSNSVIVGETVRVGSDEDMMGDGALQLHLGSSA